MNCYYHTKKDAVLHCQKCNKELCYDCYSMFKSHFCMDCEKETLIKKLTKSAVLLISAIIIPIILYFLYINAVRIGNSFNEFVNAFYDVAKGLLGFPNIASAEIGDGKIIISEELIIKLAPYLLIYIFSSIPFGWYLLSKLFSHSLSGSIIVIAFIAIIKFEISFFIGPFVTPIVIIVLIVSLIKNSNQLIYISKQEKKYMLEIIKNSTELKVVSEE